MSAQAEEVKIDEETGKLSFASETAHGVLIAELGPLLEKLQETKYEENGKRSHIEDTDLWLSFQAAANALEHQGVRSLKSALTAILAFEKSDDCTLKLSKEEVLSLSNVERIFGIALESLRALPPQE